MKNNTKENPENFKVDKLDIQILKYLMKNAAMPYTEIARELIVSSGTIHVRMNKLQKMGAILGSSLIINPRAIGYDICAFIGMYLEKGSLYNEVIEQLKVIPEIVELHYTTGTFGMFAKIICKDSDHLREVLGHKIQEINGLARTETFISLEETIKRQIQLD